MWSLQFECTFFCTRKGNSLKFFASFCEIDSFSCQLFSIKIKVSNGLHCTLQRLLDEKEGVENINNSLLNKLETLEDIRHRAEDFFLEICDVMLHRTEQAQSYDAEDDHCESSSRNSCDVDVIDSASSKDPANVLVVSHKGLIREMLRYFCSELGCQLPRRSGRRVNWDSSYTGMSVFRITVERTDDLLNNIHVESLLLNDNSHLSKRSNDSGKLGESPLATP
ncbi:fructose-2,6-bisphosphatase TIGAR [Paramuricea clavata]|uniref:Fructose-2,6-bisphosphatase TIGAR n=1 Tax=Paramuricea clavata TaxID=317549 RepID=A0A6S7J157_PARCT|nr:fructose-2,6-bisphosphatase TIGAR [Paramuricea clavata]